MSEEVEAQTAPKLALLAALFFTSGATGLVYEVAWSKRLELTFGSTTYSIGVVLAAYMAGLGLGAWACGRWADRAGSPARRYAILELGIGLYALVAPWVLDGVELLYVAAAGQGGNWLKAGLGLLAILPATVLMGGTLPVLARSLVQRRADAQRAVGLLYGINTLGAVTGAVLAGFWLTSWLGLDVVSRATGAINLGLAALAWGLDARLAPHVVEAPEGSDGGAAEVSAEEAAARRVRHRAAIAVTFGVGLVALSLEVAWTRALSLAYGATGHAFTIMLAATLTGIGLGSLLAARPAEDERAPLKRLSGALLLLAGACYVFLLGYELLPRTFFVLAQPRVLTYPQLLAAFFGISGAVLLPATLAFGLAFPLAAQLGVDSAEGAGRSVGLVYFANTAGSIAGSMLGAFVLVPVLGSAGVIRAGALAAAGGACVFAWLAVRQSAWSLRTARPVVALGVVLGLASVSAPAWNPAHLDLAPTRRLPEGFPDQPGDFDNAFRRGGFGLRYAKEGLNAYVTVRSVGEYTVLLLGGKPDASTVGDMPTQLLCGALPVLARPEGTRALVIGAGSGVSARVVCDAPAMERVDLVEIETAMVEAARECFGGVNDGVFDHEDLNLIVDDARTYLLAYGGEPYDVIISVPTNPSIAGVANLFTAEFYAQAKRNLTPDGVYTQWIQLYDSDDWMGRSMLRTFCESFPHVQLWFANASDMLLMGSREPMPFDLARVEAAIAANPGLARDLWPRLGCRSAEEVCGRFLMTREELLPLLSSGEILHDRLPRLEGHAARARYTSPASALLISDVWEQRAARRNPWPPLVGETPGQARSDRLNALAARVFVVSAPHVAEQYLDQMTPSDPEGLALRARLLEDPQARRELLDAALAEHPDASELLLLSAQLHAQRGEGTQARTQLARLAAQAEPQPAAFHLLRAQLVEPSDRTRSDLRFQHLRAGLAAVLPTDPDQEVRRELLSLVPSCAAQTPAAVELLAELLEARWWDVEAGLALGDAYLVLRTPEHLYAALELSEALIERNLMADSISVRTLRLRALNALDQLGHLDEGAREQFFDEVQALFEDFPQKTLDRRFFALLRMLRERDD